jgi:hypothetical protein
MITDHDVWAAALLIVKRYRDDASSMASDRPVLTWINDNLLPLAHVGSCFPRLGRGRLG